MRNKQKPFLDVPQLEVLKHIHKIYFRQFSTADLSVHFGFPLLSVDEIKEDNLRSVGGNKLINLLAARRNLLGSILKYCARKRFP